MKLSEVIVLLTEAQTIYGDIECFSSHIMADCSPRPVFNEGQYPDDWCMPKEFLIIGEDN